MGALSLKFLLLVEHSGTLDIKQLGVAVFRNICISEFPNSEGILSVWVYLWSSNHISITIWCLSTFCLVTEWKQEILFDMHIPSYLQIWHGSKFEYCYSSMPQRLIIELHSGISSISRWCKDLITITRYKFYQKKICVPKTGRYEEELTLCHRIFLRNFIIISNTISLCKYFHYKRNSRSFNSQKCWYIETPI